MYFVSPRPDIQMLNSVLSVGAVIYNVTSIFTQSVAQNSWLAKNIKVLQ